MAKYKITNAAQEDLRNIWDYTKNNWSRNQANKYFNQLIAQIEYISQNPHVGQLLLHVRKNYRSLSMKSHRIYYKSVSDNTIEIVRILHQKMDVENWLD